LQLSLRKPLIDDEKAVPSSALEPINSGTSFCLPAAKTARTSAGSTQPSTLAADCSLARSISSADFALRAANESAPSDVATLAPAFSMSANFAMGAKFAPLSPMARWNSPLVSGDATRRFTLHDPADSPKIVTRFGSPPNCAMFR
jgi:hypothetical protein